MLRDTMITAEDAQYFEGYQRKYFQGPVVYLQGTEHPP